MQQLSGLDASFIYFETPNTPMHIGSLNIYDPSSAPDGKIRFQDILRHIEARLHTVRSFRQKLVRVPGDLDHPYWIEDSDFDLEFHVRHIALPARDVPAIAAAAASRASNAPPTVAIDAAQTCSAPAARRDRASLGGSGRANR